jgi:hypothetical protein
MNFGSNEVEALTELNVSLPRTSQGSLSSFLLSPVSIKTRSYFMRSDGKSRSAVVLSARISERVAFHKVSLGRNVN